MLLSSSLADVLPNRAATFDNHKVYRLYIKTKEHYKRYSDLVNDPNLGVQAWAESFEWFDVMIPPTCGQPCTSTLESIPHELKIQNVQYLIDMERDYSKNNAKRLSYFAVNPSSPESFFSDYQDYQTIKNFFSGLPGVSRKSIGQTYEGNEIWAFEFGTGSKRIVFNGGIHAREWISPAVVSYIGHYLAVSNDADAVNLRSQFTFSVIPVLNPDGYNYTRTHNRMWRKNRQPNTGIGAVCTGIDPNRNFGYHWHEGGSSGITCLEDYRGSEPFQAKESLHLSEYVKSLPNVVSYIDFHSYSQLWMYPWGFKCDPSDIANKDKLHQGALLAVQALGSNFGIKYAYGRKYVYLTFQPFVKRSIKLLDPV